MMTGVAWRIQFLTPGVNVETEVVHSGLMNTVDGHMKAFAATLEDPRGALWTERLIAEDPVSLAHLGERFRGLSSGFLGDST